MSDHSDATRAMNATINDMMQQPISDFDQILHSTVVWEDDDLDEIHADAEEAQSLDPDPVETETDTAPSDSDEAAQHTD